MSTYSTVTAGLVQEWRLDEAEAALLAAAEAGDHGRLLRLVQLVKGKAGSEARREVDRRQEDRRQALEATAARYDQWLAECDAADDRALAKLDQAQADWRAKQAGDRYEAEQRPTYADPIAQLRP